VEEREALGVGGGGGLAGSIAWLPGGEAREEHTVVVNPNQLNGFDAIPYLLGLLGGVGRLPHHVTS
jgi:hypothetical protein